MDETQAQIIMVTVAVICFLITAALVYTFLRSRRRMQTWATAEATVTRAYSHRGSGATVHEVEFTFTARDGRTYEGTGTTDEERERDDVIEIRYDPEKPSRNHAGFSDIKVWYVLGFPVILLFLAFGILALLDGLSVVDLS